ncbi:MAG TPA: hypothetical protein VLZ81_16100 [Blastocatellia bacterium]|nr:hypothetical protein [Blastocatellia bacterium]
MRKRPAFVRAATPTFWRSCLPDSATKAKPPISPVSPGEKFGTVSGLLLLTISLALALAASTGCQRKPSYSDIKVNQSGGLANQNSSSSNNIAAALAAGSQTPVPGSSAAQANASPHGAVIPAFFDQKTGQIKDLPMIPHSRVESMQYGPSGGFMTMSMQAKTVEPFDKITAFYDSAIKSAGWRIVTNDRNTDEFTWRLVKGDDDGATVQVAKGPKPGVTFVSIIRLNHLPEPKSSPTP